MQSLTMLFLLFYLALGALWAAPSHAGAGALQPHRAVYEMALVSAQASSGVSGLQGRMVIEWKSEKCTTWKLNQRLMLEVSDSSGAVTLRDLRFSSREDMQGDFLVFDFSRFANGRLVEEISGEAARGKGAQAWFAKPEVPSLSLPSNVVFPTGLTRVLLRAAEKGQRMLSRPVYEGGDLERYSKVFAFVGKPGTAAQELQALSLPGKEGGLREETFWPVQLSYHYPDNQEGLPGYQVSYHLFRNGVISHLKLDYDDFSMSGRLSLLEYLDIPPCLPGRE